MENFRKILIDSHLTIRDGLKKMDEAGSKLLVITDQNDKLQGVVSDGDIRRFILKGGDLTAGVSKVLNPAPVFVSPDTPDTQTKELMVNRKIECIPVIDSDHRVTDVLWWGDLFGERRSVREKIDIPVVIMAGGRGTRLHPFTKVLPKPLIPIHDKPIIEIIMDRFQEYGCGRFLISVNHMAGMIKAYLGENCSRYKIEYFQEDKPLGTAGSLFLIKPAVKGTFFVSNCDILIDADYSDILAHHKKQGNAITLIVSMKHFTIPYGVVDIRDGGTLDGIREKPEFDFFVNTGMYVMEPSALGLIPENTACLMTDLVSDCRKKGLGVGVYPVSDKSWVDIGQWEEYQSVIDKLGMK